MRKFIGKPNDRILCKLSKSEILRLYSIIHVAMETMKTSQFTCRSKSFISIFFTCQFQLVSCNLSLAMIWQMTYTHKLPTLCSATLTLCELDDVTADLYHAEWPNKPRIIRHYKINMLSFPFLLVHRYTLFVCIWSKYLKVYLRKWSLIQISMKKHSLYNLNWSCFEHTVSCANKLYRVVLQLYVYVKLSKNQSWVNLLFSVSRDSIHDLFLDSSFSISYRVENRDLQWTVNLLLNRTVHEVLREVHAIKFIFIVICINDKLIIFISG